MSADIEKVFEKLKKSGIKEAVLFTKTGQIVKTTVDELKAKNLINLSLQVIEQSGKIIKNVTGSKTSITKLKASTEGGTIHIILGKNHILTFQTDKINDSTQKFFMDIANRIENLFK